MKAIKNGDTCHRCPLPHVSCAGLFLRQFDASAGGVGSSRRAILLCPPYRRFLQGRTRSPGRDAMPKRCPAAHGTRDWGGSPARGDGDRDEVRDAPVQPRQPGAGGARGDGAARSPRPRNKRSPPAPRMKGTPRICSKQFIVFFRQTNTLISGPQ